MATFNLKNYLTKMAKDAEVTEGQLRPERDHDEPKVITQKQLDAQREGEAGTVTEKQLDKTRKSAAADPSITEGVLNDENKGNKEPEQVTEKQLDDRKDGPEVSTEAQLEKVRTGAAETLTEHRLDNSKSTLVKHRNPKASAGDINKLEEQRLAGKPVEKEVAKPASKGRSIYDKVGKGDLARLANSLNFPVKKKLVE